MSFIKALEIIRDNDIMRPKQLAKKLWPDSDGWKRSHKLGRGSAKGAAMALAAGGLMGRLRQRGLIGHFTPIQLTQKGKKLLQGE